MFHMEPRAYDPVPSNTFELATSGRFHGERFQRQSALKFSTRYLYEGVLGFALHYDALGNRIATQEHFDLPAFMNASMPIARLVETMLADGVDPAAIVRAVAAAERNSRSHRGDSSARSGTRLPTDWIPSRLDVEYAASRGMPADRTAIEAEKFKNYWIAKSGAGSTKRDWSATWRNWVLTAMEGRHVAAANSTRPSGATSAAGRAPTGADAVLTGMGRLARRLAEDRDAARSTGRPLEACADTSGGHDVD